MSCTKHPHKSRAAAEAQLRQMLSRKKRLRDGDKLGVYPCARPDVHRMREAFHVGHDPNARTLAEEVQRREERIARRQLLDVTPAVPAPRFTVRKLTKKQ